MSDDEIFCAALELPTANQQRVLVESLCAGNSEQCHRVWRLLETHHTMLAAENKSQMILDRAGLVFQAFSGVSELLPGKRVGSYVLQELIGEGATSLVFRARQLPPAEREVALKILKPGMDSQRILARFGLEHQVLQRLQHPGITPVFDAGVHENGRPFFAMELVPEALTITRYAEKFRLDLRKRIQLMIAACEIVQHAHQRGIIHRDLKPSNILVEGIARESPRPRIIDFGIAKILQAGDDSSNVTTLGDRFGTPAYMSPEQALMRSSGVDIRSDVYSLGVVFYELLTGLTPRSASQDAADELPWTSEAYWKYRIPSPSELRKLHPESPRERTQSGVENELDLIAFKAIAGDQQERYQTVADFQRDLQRFLNGEPVEAAGPGLVYRLRKMVHRNRTLSVAVLVTLATIVSTSVLTASFAFRAHKAESQVRLQLKETLNAQKELLVQRDRAKDAMRQSQSLLRVFQVQTVTDRALARFLKEKLDAAMRGQVQAQSGSNAVPVLIQLEVLTKPHPRLIVQGDWTWASSRFPAEIINTSFQISSREAAQSLSQYQNQPAPPTAGTQETAATQDLTPTQASSAILPSDRESLQVMLLEELKAVLPANDPFIAEVLDNCGLQALDNSQLPDAERFLNESVHVWSSTNMYPANLVQSQLFLVEALSRQDKADQAAAMLDAAKKTLSTVPDSHSHTETLRSFCDQLELSIERLR